MKRIKNSYANLISKDAKTRLFQFLKDWADQEGERVGNKVVIENYLTKTILHKSFALRDRPLPIC
jgi:CRP/FNR family transcriptional regulator